MTKYQEMGAVGYFLWSRKKKMLHIFQEINDSQIWRDKLESEGRASASDETFIYHVHDLGICILNQLSTG